MLLALKAATLAPAAPEDCLRLLEKNLRQVHKDLPSDKAALQYCVANAFHYLCIAGLLDPDQDGWLELCIAALVGCLVQRLINAVATPLACRASTRTDDALIANVCRPVGLFLPATAACRS